MSLRLLIRGYAAAAAVAAAAGLAGLPLVFALLIFWLGGAAAVLALGAFALRRPRPAVARDEAELAAALRRWEEDRLADRSAAPAAETASG